MEDVCTCGHAEDEHGGDEEFPGSTACAGMTQDNDDSGDAILVPCDCICYEEDDFADDMDEET